MQNISKNKFKLVKAAINQYAQIWLSYKSVLFAFVIISIIFASLPIFLGRFLGGENYVQFFKANGGGNHPEAFLIIGTNTWTFLSFTLWDYSVYIREEQQSGTLESLMLTPANQSLILLGRGFVTASIAVFTFATGVLLGLAIFDSQLLFSLDFVMFLVVLFVVFIGFIPLLGIALFLGGFVFKFKEVYNLIGFLQFVFGTLMGVFFPITILPIFVQIFSVFFPGTWIVQDIRYIVSGSPPMLILLGLESIFGNIPIILDVFIIIILGIIWAVLGFYFFSRILKTLKREEGIGNY